MPLKNTKATSSQGEKVTSEVRIDRRHTKILAFDPIYSILSHYVFHGVKLRALDLVPISSIVDGPLY